MSEDGRTQNVGYVHVGNPDAINERGHWVCADNCPHPDHENTGGQFGSDAQ